MADGPTHRPRWRRIVLRGGVVLVALYVLLLIPEASPPMPKGAGQQPFVWNHDTFWSALEAKFIATRKLSAGECEAQFDRSLKQVYHALDSINATNLPPDAPAFEELEMEFFQLAPLAAACPARMGDFMKAAGQMRDHVKWHSQYWPPDSVEARRRIYRLLYGGRAAVEEALLQSPQATNALQVNHNYELPKTPGAEVRGVMVQSGDILVSRGGAATSALIARGNDFPGNFSHIALVHVDAQTKKVSVIEAHIESGVGVRSIEAYLTETKLRILLLRPHGLLPALAADPMLPHKAASLALSNALAGHIPYDFAMDHTDPAKQFCSEVASAAYLTQGVTLWAGVSHLSTPGVTSWLAALGVRNFETQEPSDLEYDPQLRVVAEWRDPDTLFKDHVDNGVIAALLEGAERGERLAHNHWLLPPVRLMKAWSVVLNQFGKVGPIPEGMSATTALRVDWLKANHAAIAARVMVAAEKFKAARGYPPPYWELLRMAREAKTGLNPRK
ncbi:MAG: hypothetical protein EXS35_00240 [Pedosphaera sp.]|nr:hypothetical protein [Pedosphaera sp.]